MQVTLVEGHLRHCNDAEKNPKKSSSHTDLTSKSSQSFFKIMDQFGVNHGNCLVEYDVELCATPILDLSMDEFCGIFVCFARSFSLKLVIMHEQISEQCSCFPFIARRVESFIANIV